MFESVGSVSSGMVGSAARMPPVSARAESTATQTGVSTVPLSPHMKADPVAGVVIAQYLTNDGETIVQVPSTKVVAYLRAGLSESGLPVKDPAVTAEA